MEIGMISFLMVVSILCLLFLGAPVAFSLIGVSLIFTIIFWTPKALYIVASATWGAMNNEVYLAVPLFIFMANILTFSGIADDLYDTLWKWVGSIKGGLSIATAAAITILDALTGVGATGIVTMGQMAFPHMEKHKYDRSISVGVIPVASALGPLIPPSNIMIILGSFTGLSIGDLFVGGVVPGIIMSVSFILYIYVRCSFNPGLAPSIPLEERPFLKEKILSLKGIILPILIVILMLGGIYTGMFTPVEASGIGALGALISTFINRKFVWANLRDAAVRTLSLTATVLWIVIGGSCFSAFLSASGAGDYLGNFFLGLPVSPLRLLIILIAVVLIMGMFLESISIMMMTIPIFFPAVESLGCDTLWFGVIYVIGIIIGYVTPPLGYNLFYMRGVLPATVSTKELFKTVMPFIPIMVGVLVLVFLIPELITWLPRRMQ